ncbi:hypothetical protein GCM10008106_28990 [Mongoliitalea lutea]|uniref:Uncharacterized protein n=2 Tax=Mongoliitalea lutea TaxID=849756 RepID=A0A8J3CZ92_9BACT|nr:hypothetical protein GCM10008106_28990 [Mongoliitalea lutea]
MSIFKRQNFGSMKHLVRLLVFQVLLISCSQSKKEADSSNQVAIPLVRLEKIDSIQIAFLGSPIVQDIDPNSRTILFTEPGNYSEDIYVTDFEGNIIHSYSKFGNLPDTYGVLFAPLKIVGENAFLAYGINGLLTYDFSGQLLSRTKILDIQPYNFAKKSMGFSLGILEEEYLYFDQGSRNIDYSYRRLYEEVNAMILLDKITGKREEMMQIPESSLYRNGKYFYRDAWAPIFELTEDELLVVYGAEPKIYVYEKTRPFRLIKEIPLDIPDYNFYKGEDVYNPDSFLNFFSYGRIETITQINGYFILGYFPGYDPQDLATSKENKSPEEWQEFRQHMLKKYPHRVAIFDTNGSLINDFVPSNVDPRNIVQRDGQLWAMGKVDMDIERDYFMVYKLELKFDD